MERLSEILSPAFLDRIHFLAIPGLDISSTEIRRRVKLGHTVRYLAPDGVLAYIEEKKLYL
jgi:nicotinate-nucleotide adenylyltransferase